jgi:predicted ATPase
LIKGLIRRTVDDVITIGQALIRQKAALPHGSFLPWIDAKFAMSESAARKMMTVAREFGGKSVMFTDLNATALYELAAPSTPSEIGW